MSEYVTVRNFLDTEVRTEEYPKGKLYEKGEKFPAEGLKVSEERLRQLSTYDNSAGDIFIKKVDENKETINPFKDEGTETEEVKENDEATKAEEEVKENDEAIEAEEEVKENDEATEAEETTEAEEPKTKKASTRGRRKKAD